MSIIADSLNLARDIAGQMTFPAPSGLYLPEREDSPEIRDEFGLLFLENGVVAPFYASLPGALDTLWLRFPGSTSKLPPLMELISLFPEEDPAYKAIALGAFNAMGQHLMKQAGLLPLRADQDASMGSADPRPGERVGMVGYFCPLIDKLLARGVEVLVIEKQPGRVELRPGLTLSENPADLADCRVVLCTAATLINDSLDDIIAHCAAAENFSLIGPSGSGLPDILFARGVDAVGGVYFPNQNTLDERLRNRESWGNAGQKYQLTPRNYPGYKALLSHI